MALTWPAFLMVLQVSKNTNSQNEYLLHRSDTDTWHVLLCVIQLTRHIDDPHGKHMQNFCWVLLSL